MDELLVQEVEIFNKATLRWVEDRFGVTELDADTEIISSIASKEAIYNTFLLPSWPRMSYFLCFLGYGLPQGIAEGTPRRFA